MQEVEKAPPMTVTLSLTLSPVTSTEDAAERIGKVVNIIEAIDATWVKLSAQGVPDDIAVVFQEAVANAKAGKPFRDFKIVK